MPRLRASLAFALAAGCSLVGCDELGEFRTGPDEVFQGQVIGSEGDATQPSFIRNGFAAGTRMALTFDPGLAVPPDDESAMPAGTITTYRCPSDREDCSAEDGEIAELNRAELEPIPELSHDALGLYELPGGNRLRNYMFGARFVSGEGLFAVRRNAMVFLSLLESGGVEVRVVAPSVLGADGRSELFPGLFGVFPLARERAR